MSKNMTRKGLAFGALVALGASVFAGAPAYAADTMVLTGNYSSDTTLATAATGTFTLNASLAPGSVAGNISQLKYKVVNNGALTVVATPNNSGTAATVTAVAGSGYATGGNATALTTNTLALSLTSATSTSTTQTVTVTAFLDANTNGALDTGETQATQTVSFLKFSEITTSGSVTAPTKGDTTVSGSFKFTNINNQSIPADQIGANFTLFDGTAIPAAALSGSQVSIPAATPDTTTTAGYAVFTTSTAHGFAKGDFVAVAGAATTTAYNATYQITSVPTTTSFEVKTATTGAITGAATTATLASRVVKAGVSYSVSKGLFSYTTSAVTTLDTAQNIKIQPLLNNASPAAALVVGDTAMTVGSSAAAIVSARTLWSVSAGTVKSTTIGAATLASGDNTTATAPAAGVYTAASSIGKEKQVTFTVKSGKSAATAKAWASQAVNVSVSLVGQTLSATETLTVNGTSYTTAAALPGATGIAKLALTTDANGKVTITYKTTATWTATNSVRFIAYVENSTAQLTVSEDTRVYTGAPYIANYENGATTTDGAAVTVNFVVIDQFGAAPTDNSMKVTSDKVSAGQTLGSTAAGAGDSFALVVGGKATITLLDNGTGIGVDTYKFDLYSLDALGAGTIVAASKFPTTASANVFTVNIVAAADATVGTVKLTNSSWTELGKDLAEVNYVNATTTLGASDATYKTAVVYSDFAGADLRDVVPSAPDLLSGNGLVDLAGAATADYNGGRLDLYGVVSAANTATVVGGPVAGAQVTVSGTNKLFGAEHDSSYTYGVDKVTVDADLNGRFHVRIYSHLAGKQIITVTSGAGKATYAVWFGAAQVADAKTVSVKVGDGAAQFQADRSLDVLVHVQDKFANPIRTNASGVGTLYVSQTGAGYIIDNTDGRTDIYGDYAVKLVSQGNDLGTSKIEAYLLQSLTDSSYDIVTTASTEFGVTDVDATVGGRAIYASVEFAKGKTVTVTVDGKRLYSKLFTTDAYTELKFTQKTAGKHSVSIRVAGGIGYSGWVTTTK